MKNQLLLSTVAFAIAFALWGSIAGVAPFLKKLWGLTPFETALLVSLPVILGSLGRIPMGLLVDRFGPRLTMTLTLAFSGFCALGIGFGNLNYPGLLALGVLMGVSGTAFVIGVAHLSHWYPKTRQGTALGVFGLGNMGQSIALCGIPWLASLGSWKIGFVLLGLLSLVWAGIYLLKAREYPELLLKKNSFVQVLRFLQNSPRVWVLSLYYFLTFGGFVAMSVYLPTLLKELFLISPQEAGIRTAVFVILATLMRPLGGWLSDRRGAQKILGAVFLGFAVSTFLLMAKKIFLFTLGTTGFAICAGLGNGAVFKLVPHYFPKETGTATGLVGSAGGLGGFFPPLVMALSLQTYENYFLGWIGLFVFSLLCLAILWNSILNERREAASILVKEEMEEVTMA